MKHLKIRGTYRALTNEVRVEILQQTHRGNQFGNSKAIVGFRDEFEHNGLKLISAGGFAYYGDENFFLHGAGDDIESILIPVEMWPKLKDAVNAYNEWGKDQ